VILTKWARRPFLISFVDRLSLESVCGDVFRNPLGFPLLRGIIWISWVRTIPYILIDI